MVKQLSVTSNQFVSTSRRTSFCLSTLNLCFGRNSVCKAEWISKNTCNGFLAFFHGLKQNFNANFIWPRASILDIGFTGDFFKFQSKYRFFVLFKR